VHGEILLGTNALMTFPLDANGTASEDEAAPEGLNQYGFSESFKKPFDIALLGERIRTMVEEKRENM